MSWQERLGPTKQLIEEVLPGFSAPAIAFSGGKDSIVVAHILKQYGVKAAILDLSFYFPKQKVDAAQYADELGLEWIEVETITWDYLRKHPEAYFPQDLKKNKYKGIAQRQWKSIPKGAKQLGSDIVVFGRRLAENHTPDYVVSSKNRDYCSFYPIRDWSTLEVWEYMRDHGLRIPWIYGTPFGRWLNNAPWITLIGSRYWCWQNVYDTDPETVYEAAREGLKDAIEFLKMDKNDPRLQNNDLGRSWFSKESSTISPYDVYGIPNPETR